MEILGPIGLKFRTLQDNILLTDIVENPVGRLSNSDWFVNSFTIVVYEIIFFSSVRIWCSKDD